MVCPSAARCRITACKSWIWRVISGLPRHMAARVGIAPIHLENYRRAQAHQVSITFWEEFSGLLIGSERLFEPRASDTVADALCKVAQIEALVRRIRRAQQALQSPLQVLRANQERLGLFLARLDQTHCGPRRQGGEELLCRPCRVKLQSVV